MSMLWRTEDWLNFGELTLAWAAALPEPVAKLRMLFLADIFAGTLDDAGPARLVIRPGGPNESVTSADLNRFVAEHRNSVWVAVEASRLPPIGHGIGLLTFDRARELRDMVHAADVVTYLWHTLFVSRVMTLAFARLRELPPPIWWRPRPAPEPVADPDPSERLTLAEQLRLVMASGMPEDQAKARLSKAFQLCEITYRPLRALPYEDAKIDWDTGQVTLRRLPQSPFTPTLTAAEFFAHFLPGSERLNTSTAAQAAPRGADTGQIASETRTVSQPESIPLIEAVHDLRVTRNTDLRSATSALIDMLATGQLPPADALVDGVPAKIDSRWWWAGAIEYPNSSAAFNLIIDAEPRLTRATKIALDRRAWERQRSRIAATAQQGEASGEPVLADMGEPQPSTHPESAQSPARASTPRPRAPDAEVRKWYEGTYIPECQTAGKRPSEAKDWAAAKLKFGDKVRREQIRDLRRALAPDDWRIQGRRPSSTNSAENSAE